MSLAQLKILLNSSSFRFALGVMGGLWLVFALVLLMLYQMIGNTLWKNIDTSLERQRQRVEELLIHSIEPVPEERVQKILEQIAQRDGVKVELAPAGTAYFGAPPHFGTPESPPDGRTDMTVAGLPASDLAQHYLNLSVIPAPHGENWRTIDFVKAAAPDSFRSKVVALPSGQQLRFSRDIRHLEEVDAAMRSALVAGLPATFLLLLAATFYFTRRTVTRLGDINATCDTIIQGNLTQRVPVTARNDDYDHMAHNINAMLNRIQALMEGVQEVSDNIAHDLRTPLARLRNRLNDLAPDTPGKDKIMRDTDQILSLFNTLLRITKLEQGAFDMPAETLNLTQLLTDVVELYEPLANDKTIAIEQHLVPCRVTANRDLLFQAFSNLFDNAIKYTPAGGTIRLHCEAHRVVLCDSGGGIPAAERNAVFRRMYRLEKHRHSPGHGLGLTMVKAVFDYHRWSMTLGDGEPGLRVEIEPGGEVFKVPAATPFPAAPATVETAPGAWATAVSQRSAPRPSPPSPSPGPAT